MEKGKGLYPGCLAMIKGMRDPRNNGLVVVCVKPVQAGTFLEDVNVIAGLTGWHIHNKEKRLTATRYQGFNGPIIGEALVADAAIAARYLFPLGGPDLAIDTDTAKPKEVPTKEDVF